MAELTERERWLLEQIALRLRTDVTTGPMPDQIDYLCATIDAWLSDPAPASPDGTDPNEPDDGSFPKFMEAVKTAAPFTPPAPLTMDGLQGSLIDQQAAYIVDLLRDLSRAASDGFARGVEAAAKEVVQYRCDPNRNRDCYVQNATAVEIDKAIRSLSPPPQRESDEIAKLREECDAHASKNNERAAWWFKKGLEAAVEVVDRDCLDFTIKELTGRILALAFPAQRESASDPLVEWLRDMRDHLKEGFMVCDRCGFDMSTKDMDVVDDIDAAINHATGAKALARRAPREGK